MIVKIAKGCYVKMRLAQKDRTFRLAKNFKNQIISITMRRNNTVKRRLTIPVLSGIKNILTY